MPAVHDRCWHETVPFDFHHPLHTAQPSLLPCVSFHVPYPWETGRRHGDISGTPGGLNLPTCRVLWACWAIVGIAFGSALTRVSSMVVPHCGHRALLSVISHLLAETN